MTDVPASAVVRFRVPGNGAVVGHGVLVDDEHVVTCAHVVNLVLGRELTRPDAPTGAVVRVEFPVGARVVDAPPSRAARVDAWAAPGTTFDAVDAAGLTLVDEGPPAHVRPMPMAERTPSSGPVLLYGPVENRPGGWVSAVLRPAVNEHRRQLEQRVQGAFVAQPGFSGTPVVDEATGQMLGLLVATATARGATDAYAVPVTSLAAMWPDVFGSVPPSPYKGLEAFRREDRELFFGRSRITGELVRRVAGGGLVAVVGASGVGKSSLLQAGVVPVLLDGAGAQWTVVSIRPRPTMTLALAAGFARAASPGAAVSPAELDRWEQRILRDGLAPAALRLCASTGTDRLLVLVDQLEEAVADDSSEFAAVLNQLAEFADREGAATAAVVALREDAFGTFFVRHPAFGEKLRQNAIALRGMDADELAQVISRPAALRNVVVRPQLVAQLARDAGDRPGILPLLEFSLDQMWQTLRPGQTELSFDAYAEIGQLSGALTTYADGVLASFDDTEHGLVRHLFLTHLTSPDDPDTRRVARRMEIAPAEWSVALRLAAARLVTIGQDGEGRETVEVVHEALLRAWATLREWQEAEEPFRRWRRLLQDTIAQDAADGAESAVLTGSVLATSERWFAERGADLTAPERRLIERSLRRDEDEKHRYRRLYLSSRAQIVARMAKLIDDDEVALLLAVEAFQAVPDVDHDQLVRDQLARLGRDVFEPAPEDGAGRGVRRMTVRDWAYNQSDDALWTLGESGSAIRVNGRGRVTAVVAGAEVEIPVSRPVVVAAYEPAANTACLVDESGVVEVWQISGVAELIGRRALGVPAMCVALTRDAGTLAIATDDGAVRVLGAVDDLAESHRIVTRGFRTDIDVNQATRLVATSQPDGRAMVWAPDTGELRCHVKGARPPLAISDSGDYLFFGWGPERGRIPISADALLAFARQATDRVLTAEERRQYLGEEPGLTDR